MIRRFCAASAATLALVAGACSDEGERADRASQSSDRDASGKPSSDLTVRAVASFDVPAPVLKLAAWDGYVAWVTGPEVGDYPSLSVWDETSREIRTVARAPQPSGQIVWARGSGTHIVYVEFSHALSDATPSTPWRVIALDIASGSRREVASSTQATECCAPFPVIDERWIVWIGGSQDATAPIVAFDIETRAEHDVITTDAGIAWVDGDVVVYGASSSTGRDAYIVPIDGSIAPQRITTSGRVSYLVARDAGRIRGVGGNPDH